MKSLWVTRDGANEVDGVFANEQFLGQEKLTDENQEVIDFLAPPVLQPIEKARVEYPKFAELVEAMVDDRAGNPAKINIFFATVIAARQKHGV